MALRVCPNCGKEYSEHIDACPKCGVLYSSAIHLKEEKTETPEGGFVKWLKIGLVAAGLYVIVAVVLNVRTNAKEHFLSLYDMRYLATGYSEAGEAIIEAWEEADRMYRYGAQDDYFDRDLEEVRGAEFWDQEADVFKRVSTTIDTWSHDRSEKAHYYWVSFFNPFCDVRRLRDLIESVDEDSPIYGDLNKFKQEYYSLVGKIMQGLNEVESSNLDLVQKYHMAITERNTELYSL